MRVKSPSLYDWMAVVVIALFFLTTQYTNQGPSIPKKSELFVPEQYSFYYLRPRAEHSKTELWKYNHGTQKKIRVFPWLDQAQLSPDQSLLAGLVSRKRTPTTLTLWNLTKGLQVPRPIPQSDPVQRLIWSQTSDTLLFSTSSGYVEVNIRDGGSTSRDPGIPKTPPATLEILGQSDGKTILAARDPENATFDRYFTYRTSSNELKTLFSDEQNPPLTVSIAPEQKIIIGLWKDKISFVNLDGEIVQSLDLQFASDGTISPLSPNGRHIVLRGENQSSSVTTSLILLDIEKMRQVSIHAPKGTTLNHSAWTPDSRALFMDSDQGIVGFEVANKILRELSTRSPFSPTPFSIRSMNDFLSFIE